MGTENVNMLMFSPVGGNMLSIYHMKMKFRQH